MAIPDWIKVTAVSAGWALVGRVALESLRPLHGLSLWLFIAVWIAGFVFVVTATFTDWRFALKFTGFCMLCQAGLIAAGYALNVVLL